MKLLYKDGNFWIGSCYEGKPKKSDKNGRLEEDLENIDDNIWVVVKSLKINNNNKV